MIAVLFIRFISVISASGEHQGSSLQDVSLSLQLTEQSEAERLGRGHVGDDVSLLQVDGAKARTTRVHYVDLYRRAANEDGYNSYRSIWTKEWTTVWTLDSRGGYLPLKTHAGFGGNWDQIVKELGPNNQGDENWLYDDLRYRGQLWFPNFDVLMGKERVWSTPDALGNQYPINWAFHYGPTYATSDPPFADKKYWGQDQIVINMIDVDPYSQEGEFISAFDAVYRGASGKKLNDREEEDAEYNEGTLNHNGYQRLTFTTTSEGQFSAHNQYLALLASDGYHRWAGKRIVAKRPPNRAAIANFPWQQGIQNWVLV